MPRISEFRGIIIQMFHREHGPPHFHAECGGDQALFEFDPVRVFRGRLPAWARREVARWAELHQDELRENWERARRQEALERIDPLD